MKSSFKQVKISGISVVVPSKSINIDDELNTIYNGDLQALERIKKVIGLQTRHIAHLNTTASDLAIVAISSLLKDMQISPQDIDAIIMVTQTPDYILPATACYIHGKMNFPTSTIAMDINQACAGYLYGLYISHTMIENGGCQKILLICGDTLSKHINPLDSNLAPIIGDGVSATLIERSNEQQSAFFDLGSEGKKFYQLIIPEGASRIPDPSIIPEPKIWETSEKRTLKQLYMDGSEIFNFAIMQEPKAFLDILQYAQQKQEELDYSFFHQANKYIVDNIVRRLKLDPQRVPNNTTGKYGNLSGCSIPATICDTLNTLERPLNKDLRVSMAGFGAGLSWGNAILTLKQDFFCKKVQFYNKENL